MATVLVYEDELHKRVLEKIFENTGFSELETNDVTHGGKDYIDHNVARYAQASQHVKVVILRDLDRDYPCAPALLADKLSGRAAHFNPDNLIFRVAVREVEAWLVADRDHFSEFFRVGRPTLDRVNPESMVRPKREMLELIQLGRMSRRDKARYVIPGLTPSSQAAGYNEAMREYLTNWSVARAMSESDSLRRAVAAIQRGLSA